MNIEMNNSKNILLVEDDGTLRSLYTELFEQAGFNVTQAVEGKDGLEKLKRGGYDLALIDVLLPEISGDKILEALKNNPPQKPIGAIVMLTNQDQEDIHDKCLGLGASGIIVKSNISMDDLLQEVKKYLELT